MQAKRLTPLQKEVIRRKIYQLLGLHVVSSQVLSYEEFNAQYKKSNSDRRKRARSHADSLGYATWQHFCNVMFPLAGSIGEVVSGFPSPNAYVRKKGIYCRGYPAETKRKWREAVESLVGYSKRGEAWTDDEWHTHIKIPGKENSVMQLLVSLGYASTRVDNAKKSIFEIPTGELSRSQALNGMRSELSTFRDEVVNTPGVFEALSLDLHRKLTVLKNHLVSNQLPKALVILDEALRKTQILSSQ